MRAGPQNKRSGTYEKRAPKTRVPITKEMAEGKEFMRTFGDLLQFHQKKSQESSVKSREPEASQEPSVESRAPEESPEVRVTSREPEHSGS